MDATSFVLLAIIILLLLVVLILIARKTSAGTFSVQDSIHQQNLLLQDVKSRLEFGDRAQIAMHEEILRAQKALDHLRVDYDARKTAEEESRLIVKRLESVIVGSYSKGHAGENILHETFKLFPPEMIAYNFPIHGKIVEFGLVLSDKKILPIDSKWPATNLLIALENEKDEHVRTRIADEIEKEVTRRIREICQYIDPNVTAPWAIAAVPDAVFSICKRAYLEAYKRHVILMSFSMTIPYILTFYSLHLQYNRSVDIQNLQAHLITIGRQLDEMEHVLEHKIAKGNTMVANAYGEYKQFISRIRGSITYLQSNEIDALNQEELIQPNGEHYLEERM